MKKKKKEKKKEKLCTEKSVIMLSVKAPDEELYLLSESLKGEKHRKKLYNGIVLEASILRYYLERSKKKRYHHVDAKEEQSHDVTYVYPSIPNIIAERIIQHFCAIDVSIQKRVYLIVKTTAAENISTGDLYTKNLFDEIVKQLSAIINKTVTNNDTEIKEIVAGIRTLGINP